MLLIQQPWACHGAVLASTLQRFYLGSEFLVFKFLDCSVFFLQLKSVGIFTAPYRDINTNLTRLSKAVGKVALFHFFTPRLGTVQCFPCLSKCHLLSIKARHPDISFLQSCQQVGNPSGASKLNQCEAQTVFQWY